MLFARFGVSSLYLSWLELRQDSLESFGLQDPLSRVFMGASWSSHRILASFRRPRWCWGGRERWVLKPFPVMVPAPPAPLQCSKICVFDRKNNAFCKIRGLKSLLELVGASPGFFGELWTSRPALSCLPGRFLELS